MTFQSPWDPHEQLRTNLYLVVFMVMTSSRKEQASCVALKFCHKQKKLPKADVLWKRVTLALPATASGGFKVNSQLVIPPSDGGLYS